MGEEGETGYRRSQRERTDCEWQICENFEALRSEPLSTDLVAEMILTLIDHARDAYSLPPS